MIEKICRSNRHSIGLFFLITFCTRIPMMVTDSKYLPYYKKINRNIQKYNVNIIDDIVIKPQN